jgi:epoxyqueuosine reductase
MEAMPRQRAEVVKRLAREVGFDLVGVTRGEKSAYEKEFREWLAAGKQGEMAYLARHLEERLDIRRKLPWVRSVVCVGLGYWTVVSGQWSVVSGGGKTGDRRQETGDGSQETEDRRQETEGGARGMKERREAGHEEAEEGRERSMEGVREGREGGVERVREEREKGIEGGGREWSVEGVREGLERGREGVRQGVEEGSARGMEGVEEGSGRGEEGERKGREEGAEEGAGMGKIARYAWGRDYHKVVEGKLRKLEKRIREMFVGEHFEIRAYVDAGPVLERELAARAGLGWVGKNTLLIHPGHGSWFVLGELVTSLELEPDAAVGDHCGTCTRCIDACPTQAITPHSVDARACLSYLTVEHRAEVPTEYQGALRRAGYLIGCDICQEVCPFNRRPLESREADFAARVPAPAVGLAEVLAWSEQEWDILTRGRAGRRAKYEMWKRNARVVGSGS